jgi:hypothetical protein
LPPPSPNLLADLDEILNDFEGKRLVSAPDALATVPIETTPAGIEALAAPAKVKAVLEDQRITRLPDPDR